MRQPRRVQRGLTTVRIIGGTWRGTRVQLPQNPAVRPTPDRVRETLFNWCKPVITKARCLDLFAGTGVLGFEAVSRGAAEAVLVEQDEQTVAAMRDLKERLSASAVDIVQRDVFSFLDDGPRPFDLIFVDPPFGCTIRDRVLQALRSGWLAAHGRVYLESPRQEALEISGWRVLREGSTKQVNYKLIEPAG